LTSPAPSRTLGAVRLLTLSRRLLGAVLTAGVCVASAAPHNHSFEELLGGSSAVAGEHAVTTHDPHSRASHWHAVIRFVKENPCLACQWHRLSGGFSHTGLSSPTVSVYPADKADPATVRSASLGQASSRAPPALL
jgi:hypothetical protein